MKHLLLLLMLALIPAFVFAQDDEGKSETDKFTELTKDAEYIEGFFDLYKKDGALYLALTEDQLHNDFLMNIEIAEGIGAGFIFGGLMLNRQALMLSLEKGKARYFWCKNLINI